MAKADLVHDVIGHVLKRLKPELVRDLAEWMA